jgi:hypothetical protein
MLLIICNNHIVFHLFFYFLDYLYISRKMAQSVEVGARPITKIKPERIQG